MSVVSRLRCVSSLLAALFFAPALRAADTSLSPATAPTSDPFPIAMYQALVRERPNENLFFSPFSLANALSMAGEGARQQTAAEMGKLLGAKPMSGNDAQPYDYSYIRTHLAELSNRLTSNGADASAQFRRQMPCGARNRSNSRSRADERA